MSASLDAAAPATAAVADILAILRERIGVDLHGYRQATIARRIANRMISARTASLSDYLHLLRTDENEPLQLLERVTIKVSRFYRNQATFDVLRAEVLPALLRARQRTPLRIWSAGCGCGEEPYTLAMLLDAAGIAGTILATDIDPSALQAAQRAEYAETAAAELPADLQERYLNRRGGSFVVRDELRRYVQFVRHDLVAGAPPAGAEPFDLVCCRNVLIYFGQPFQQRILGSLTAHLTVGGWLVLGEAEWPHASFATALAPLARNTRIFRALGGERG